MINCWEQEYETSSHRGPSAPVMSAAMQYRLILLLIVCTAQIWIRLIKPVMQELGCAMPHSDFFAWLSSATLMNFLLKKTTSKMKTI